MKSFSELDTLYPNGVCGITEEQQREYVDYCFEIYEKKGFTETFWTHHSCLINRVGEKFKVVERATEEELGTLDLLPAWIIEFEDGEQTLALVDEITLLERLESGDNYE